MRSRLFAIIILAVALAGCDCGGDDTPIGDGGPGSDGTLPGVDGGPGSDGSLPGTDGGPGSDGSLPGMDGGPGSDGSLPGMDGGPGVCTITPCQSHTYLCGNCLDDDGDGLADGDDPDCLGPCDNNEAGFYLGIPGSPPTNCGRDCYYDQDDGPGNDYCEWDFQCDPLEPGPSRCMYSDPPPPSADCPDPQDDRCHDICGPLTPNGCDCFGCCELPARSGMYVYIGSTDMDRNPTCALGDEGDPALCHPCTPVDDCLNTCERCELCLGRTAADLPADCFPPPPVDAGPPTFDAGPPSIDAGPGVDSGPPDPDAGTPPPPTCMDGRQACDLPGLPPCPAGYFCITGCCTFFG